MKKLMILCAVIITATASFAQKAKINQKNRNASTYIVYSCPMHPEVSMKKPGNCPKCGMILNASKKEQLKIKETSTYSCTMHPDIVSATAGKCSKCGMDLTASKKEQMKTKVMNGYTCPMHPEETSMKAGKCSKCGMELTKKG
jgi:Heavy metal binding domain